MSCEVLRYTRLKGHNLCSLNVFQWDTVHWTSLKSLWGSIWTRLQIIFFVLYTLLTSVSYEP